ncbi:protein bunched, class 2/F/G isoform [Uranotaenia lowii]|uniref:protein bunched, class 2/F/G isoform n=1 Tax=Uranotaenia lowii TaxID=190385 RepID=UPI0024795B8E|nr:protein bunched, class 2/F/G isoform [Uranotaenia lowii]XP_055595773.1 protein bunched, class 2/F/G isoform [Uranotaenia lowii]XP_055595774.1 protein bunched, class 2/F/G isoform [Uranotaenia lowii]XP_055595775.1 protein bunched, class 2/F/G isoform [Uranotaenia lowii]XP_055595776.1 protein bunched, class 2/F/G isoform [Uranotaenia lowii]
MAENSISSNSGLPSQVPPHQKTAASGGGGGGGGLHHTKSSGEMSSGGGGTSGKSKHANVIHRTTSESLRLGGGVGSANSVENSISSSGPPTSLNSSTSVNSISRKGGVGGSAAVAAAAAAAAAAGKTSSFMITSVTVGARTSADNGDDSADDLDESHTDDNSRITDFENETPSFSEDTFSKEDVFFASSSAIGSVPVIPTSSQYGLAIVAPTDRAHGAEALADAMHVSVTDAGINIMGHSKDDGKEIHHRNERFKVVKIESTEPFKRGRWVCMDYLDHTTLQASPKEGGAGPGGEGEASTASTIVDSNAIRTQDSGVVMNDTYSSATAPTTITSDGDTSDYHTHLAASVPTNPIVGLLNNESPGQSLNLAQPTTIGGTSAGVPISQSQQASHAQTGTVPHSLPQSQLQNALAGVGASGTGTNQTTPAMNAQPQTQQQQTPYYPHTMSNIAEITQQTHQHHQHGVTLPTSIQMHPQQSSSASSVSSNVLPGGVGVTATTSQEMNIVINNPQHTSQQQATSFPSPQQFQPQQPSQTNSPVVASIGEPMIPEATILSPSSSMTGAGTNVPSSQQQQQVTDTVSSVSAATSDPMVSSSPSATSSPVTATAAGAVSDGANSTPTSAVAPPTAVSSPSITATSTTTTTNSNSASMSAAAAAAVFAATDHLTESNLLSAVSGITAAAVAAASGEEGEKTGEDGERSGQYDPKQAPVDSWSGPLGELKESRTGKPFSLTSSLRKGLNENLPLDKSRAQASSSAATTGGKNNIYTDIALGKTIQNLMRPSPGGKSSPDQKGETLCKTACNFLKNNNQSHSIATCTALYPHRCVQDLIKEELGPVSMGSLTRSPGFGSLSNAGSLVNIHIESELQSVPSSGFQSHPGSGRSSPAQQMFHQGSPPKHLSAIGNSISIPSSARVSRAPSPSFLQAATGGEHSSASGTSAVAIDNKIEQAMDLVKSHLMFAVREEVEVLKEKISELMDRINQLEYENGILKANASQETLSQLTPTSVVASVAAAVANSTSSAGSATSAAASATSASNSAPSSAAKVPPTSSQQQSSQANNPSSNGSVS